MRRFVDGVEVDLPETDARVEPFQDRLIVHRAGVTCSAVAIRDGVAVLVSYRGRQYRVERKVSRAASTATASGEIRAPMPGQVVDVRVATGESVTKGTVLFVLEAMKTQQPFAAPFDGMIRSLSVEKGSQVDEGHLLAVVSPHGEAVQ